MCATFLALDFLGFLGVLLPASALSLALSLLLNPPPVCLPSVYLRTLSDSSLMVPMQDTRAFTFCPPGLSNALLTFATACLDA